MDPNLETIKQDNMHSITRGHVQTAIKQAENYLCYVLGHKHEQIDLELDAFVQNVKEIRRENRGQKGKNKGE